MKLHKIIVTCFLVAAVALVGILVLPANAQAATEGYYTYEVYDGEATITSCGIFIGGNVTIPSTLGGYPVTSIGDYAFDCCDLTSITIPDSVTSIGKSAFYRCSSLTSVTIGNGVTTIGSYAFDECSSLESITIPDSVTSIGNRAFFNCSSLESITVAAGNGKYSSDTAGVLFNKDKTLLIQAPGAMSGNYIIPNGVTSIGSSAFRDCSSLVSITIPDSVTSIGGGAFASCSSLTSITIPDSVTGIGISAFEGCSSLVSITIPDGVTSIEDYAFNGCRSLTSVTIGNGVTSIGDSAFYGCSSLTSITIPDSVTSIGSYAFYGCSSFTSITIPDSVTSIGAGAFSGCSSLTSITIPDSVTSIENYAFSWCSSLTSITIPDSVTSIENYAFDGCSSLTDVYYAADEAKWDQITIGEDNDRLKNATIHYNVLPANAQTATEGYYTYEVSNGEATITDCSTSISGDVTIPSTLGGYPVTSIGDYAFHGCSSLTSITIPDSVTSIGRSAFEGCSSLTSVTIPDSVTSIGDWAFTDCYFTSITIPDGVTSIGSGAFYGCSSLTSITIPDSVTSIGDAPFQRCSRLASITVAAGNGKYSSDTAGVLFNKDKTLLIQAPGAMSGNYIIPNGVTTIGDCAFFNCTSLTSITIPDGVTSIGYDAFVLCSTMSSVTITDPNAWCKIQFDDNPMNYATNLQILDREGNVVTDLVLDSTVTEIPTYAFKNCTDLLSVTMPASVTEIGNYAFQGCSGLTSVYYTGTKTQWDGISIGSGNTDLTGADLHYSHVHDYSLIPPVTVPATCTQDGYVEKTCIFGEIQKVILPALGHTIGADRTTVAPTCTEKGYIQAQCIACGEQIIEEYIPALEHDFTGKEIVTEPTCTEQGYTAIQCIRCEEAKKQQYTDALGHSMAVLPAVAPTCTEPGLTVGSKCSECSFVGIAQNPVAALGHTIKDGVCTTCGEKETYTVTFLNEDGTELSKAIYHYGDTVKQPETPTKAADNTYTYAFAGWDQEVAAVSGDAVYTATYKETYIEYTIVFKDWNGEVISTKTYHYGDTVEVPADPTQAADETYTYTFIGWDKEVVAVNGNAEYTAVYCAEIALPDFNGDGNVTDADAVYLLRHTLFPEEYPLSGNGDVNCDGNVTDADAVYLLRYTLFPTEYPLYPQKEEV